MAMRVMVLLRLLIMVMVMVIGVDVDGWLCVVFVTIVIQYYSTPKALYGSSFKYFFVMEIMIFCSYADF